jgi:hypothetical protein
MHKKSIYSAFSLHALLLLAAVPAIYLPGVVGAPLQGHLTKRQDAGELGNQAHLFQNNSNVKQPKNLENLEVISDQRQPPVPTEAASLVKRLLKRRMTAVIRLLKQLSKRILKMRKN